MRRFILIMSLLLSACGLYAAASDIEDNIRKFGEFGAMDDGSDGERAALDLISAKLTDLGLISRRIPLDQTGEGHSFSSNIITEIDGESPGTIILAAALDSGPFGISLLLELAATLRINPPKHGITLVFLGAERGGSAFHPYGSRQAASLFAADEEEQGMMLVYVDSGEVPLRWRVRPGANGLVTPRWFIESLTGVFNESYTAYSLRGTDIQLARLGLQGDSPVLQPWMENGIPAVRLRGEGTAAGKDRITQINRISRAILNLDARMTLIPENIQSSYVLIRPFPGTAPIIIPELPFVAVFLAVSAFLVMVILFRYRDVTLNLKRFASHWWAWPLLMILVFLYLFLATLFVEETLLLADFPQMWAEAPGIFIFFKMAMTMAFSLIFITITRGLPLPRSPHFYSYSAVMTAGLGSIVLTAVDITLAAYSTITVTLLMLFIATRSIHWKTFFTILSVLPYLSGIAVVISEPYNLISESILLSRVGGNIILTLILMPLIFAVTSLGYWRAHYKQTRTGVLIPSATLILSISSVLTLIWIMNLSPYGSEHPQPVQIVDRINVDKQDRRLQVLSTAPIGAAVLSLEGTDYSLENLGRTAEIRTPANRQPLEMEYQSRSFLGRRTVRVSLSGEADPSELSITLDSGQPFTLHDSNFPFRQSPDGTSADLFVGNHPPFPLSLFFTVNGDAELTISCTASWSDPEDPPGVNRDNIRVQARRVARIERVL